MLVPSELALLPDRITNATVHNRLGFTVLLKFFQVEGRFPQPAGEVPKTVAAFIAQQLRLSEEDYRQYKTPGRDKRKIPHISLKPLYNKRFEIVLSCVP